VIVADTDVLIDALAGVNPERVRLELRRRGLAAAAVSAYELWRGARTKHARAQVGELLSMLQVLPFDAKAAQLAGAAYRELAGEGQAIGKADLYIAGVCLAERLPLLTRNRREFERVRGLRLA
jgi:predicted nucleic acid-binding protein